MNFKIVSLIFWVMNVAVIYGQDELKWDKNTLQALSKDNPEAYEKEFNTLKKNILSSKNVVQRTDFYNIHAEYLIHSNQYDAAVSFCNEVLGLPIKLSKEESIQIYIDLAYVYYMEKNKDSLIYYYTMIENAIDDDSPKYGHFLLTQGLVNSIEGQYSQAIEKTIEASKVFEALGDEKNLASAYNDIAFYFWKLKDLENQNHYLQLAIELNKSLGLIEPLILNYNNIGSNYKARNNFKKSLEYYDLAFDLIKTINAPILLAQNYTNRGNIYEALEDYTLAEQFFLQSEKVCEETKIEYGVMLANANLGNLYRILGKYDASETRLNKALDIARKLQSKKEEAQIYERMFRLARDKKDYMNALNYQSLYHSLNDSLVNESVKKEALELKEKYEAERKENQINTLVKSKLRLELMIAVLGLGLVSVFFGFNWLRARQIAKQKDTEKQSELFKQKLEFAERELLADSLKKVSVLNTKKMVHKDLLGMIQEIPNSQAQKFDKILYKLKSEEDESIITEFETRFNSVYEDFFTKLREIAPDLTPTELKFAALIRLNFSTKEMSVITNRSIGRIDNIRSNIRKKLRLSDEDNLIQRLLEL